jgi:hypothetical protein
VKGNRVVKWMDGWNLMLDSAYHLLYVAGKDFC